MSSDGVLGCGGGGRSDWLSAPERGGDEGVVARWAWPQSFSALTIGTRVPPCGVRVHAVLGRDDGVEAAADEAVGHQLAQLLG